MTFTPQIRVSGYDGSLLKNHRVFLVIYGANGTISNQSLTTDNNGLAPFTLDTVSWNGAGVSLEVSTREDQLSSKEGFPAGNLQNFPDSPQLGLPHLQYSLPHSLVLLYQLAKT